MNKTSTESEKQNNHIEITKGNTNIGPICYNVVTLSQAICVCVCVRCAYFAVWCFMLITLQSFFLLFSHLSVRLARLFWQNWFKLWGTNRTERVAGIGENNRSKVEIFEPIPFCIILDGVLILQLNYVHCLFLLLWPFAYSLGVRHHVFIHRFRMA